VDTLTVNLTSQTHQTNIMSILNVIRPPVKQAAVLLLVAIWSTVSQAQTTTNILETFNRNGALAGSSANVGDVNAGSSVWTTANAWATTNLNGGALVANTASFAQLPFAPQDGYVYTLSVTQNVTGPVGTADRWGAIGFDNGAQTQPFAPHGPWLLVKHDGRLESYYNGGGGNPGTLIAGVNSAGFRAGTNNLLQVVLDTTTPGSWKAQIKVNGIQHGSTVTLAGGSGYGISSVMVSAWNGAVVTNSGLLVTSIQPSSPTISGQPVGLTNWAGINAQLNVAVSGSAPLSYQWYKNTFGNPLPGETTEDLNFWPLQGTNSGSYFAIVTNSYGSVTSQVAVVNAETSFVMTLSPSISVGALPATGSDAFSGISTNKTYLSALNFTVDTNTSLAINDVVFQPVQVTGAGPGSGIDTVHGGSWSLTRSTVFNRPFEMLINAFGPVVDGAMATLLADAVRLQPNSVAGDTITLTLGNIIPNGEYHLRIFYQQSDVASLPVIFTFNGQGSNEVVQLDENLGASINSGGAYFIDYHFTAATNNATATLGTFSEATGPALLYGAVLEQVSAPSLAPSVTLQPVGFTNWAGFSGSLSASADGTVPLHYQWYQNGSPLSGQNGTALNFAALDGTNTGGYRVIITNVAGSVTSSVANVLVVTNGVWIYTPTLSVVQVPVTGSDVASGIAASNAYLAALDFGDDTNALAINGVNFTQVSVAGNGSGTANQPVFSGMDTNYGGSWSLTASNSAGNAAGFAGLALDAVGNVGLQADGNMQLLLTDISYIFGALPFGDYGRLTLGGLTPGARYSLRYYYRQWSSNRPIDFTFDGQGTNETVRVDLDAGGANYVNYDFVAATTNVNLTLSVNVTQQGPHFYGVTLQQTAPPAQLHIVRSGSQVTISWDTAITGYTLESSGVLPGTTWTAVPGVVNNSVTLSASTGTSFFRLRK
jgi:hypothetical protein